MHTLSQLNLTEYPARCLLLTLNNLLYVVNNHQHARLTPTLLGFEQDVTNDGKL